MFDRLRANLGLKVLAVLLAIAGWGYLRFSANPLVAARFEQKVTVPVSTIGLSAGLVARLNDRQAVVTVVLPRGETTMIAAQSVSAVVDLNDRTQGVYSVPIRVIAPKVQVSDISPNDVTVAIERIEERSIPVAVRYLGSERMVADEVHVDPPELRVRGPSSDVARVTSLRIDLPMPKRPGTIDTMVATVPRDAQGAEVIGLSASRSLVRVRATFSEAHGTP